MTHSSHERSVYGAIEAGGTKWVCAIGSGPDDIRAETRFPTTTPAEALGYAIAFFQEAQAETPLTARGVGCFGPVDLDPRSSTYGFITLTPKPGWAHTNGATTLQQASGVRVGFDTDVNAAASWYTVMIQPTCHCGMINRSVVFCCVDMILTSPFDRVGRNAEVPMSQWA